MGFFDTLGLVKTRIVFWFFLIVFVIVLIAGIVQFFQNHHTEMTSSTLHHVMCVPTTNQGRSTGYQCSGQQTYVVNGQPYSIPYMESNLPAPRSEGESSTVYYDPQHPEDASTMSRSNVAIIFLIVSAILFLIVAISYFRYEMSAQNKYWATGEGVLTGVNVVANLVNS